MTAGGKSGSTGAAAPFNEDSGAKMNYYCIIIEEMYIIVDIPLIADIYSHL